MRRRTATQPDGSVFVVCETDATDEARSRAGSLIPVGRGSQKWRIKLAIRDLRELLKADGLRPSNVVVTTDNGRFTKNKPPRHSRPETPIPAKLQLARARERKAQNHLALFTPMGVRMHVELGGDLTTLELFVTCRYPERPNGALRLMEEVHAGESLPAADMDKDDWQDRLETAAVNAMLMLMAMRANELR